MHEIKLGQSIYQTQIDSKLVEDINFLTDKRIKEKKINSFANMLSGKIKNEYESIDILREADKNRQLGKIVEEVTFKDKVNDSFDITNIKLHSCWINDQKQNEYQVLHEHSGHLITGYSLILFLKVPDFGKEFSNTIEPTNGKTDIVSNGGGLFSTTFFRIQPRVGDLYVFPYDLKHVVYPFQGNGIRRSMSCNFDIYLKKKIKE